MTTFNRLYFDVTAALVAYCNWKGQDNQTRIKQSRIVNDCLPVTQIKVGRYSYDVLPAVKFPAFLRTIGVTKDEDERMRLEFSKAAKEESNVGPIDDDFNPASGNDNNNNNIDADEEYRADEIVSLPPRAPSTRKRAERTPPLPRDDNNVAHLASYNLRKTIREKRQAPPSGKAIEKQYEKTYGGVGSKEQPMSVYANSQEENAADAQRLVGLLADDDDNDMQLHVFDNEAPLQAAAAATAAMPPRSSRAQRAAKRAKSAGKDKEEADEMDLGEEKEDDDAFDPIEDSGIDLPDEIEEAGSPDDVRTETAKLDEVLKIVQINTAAMEAQLKLAAYIRNVPAAYGQAGVSDRMRDLARIEDHMMELSRNLQTWTPMDRASAAEKTYKVIDDTDGTEVRMADCAAELGIAWNAVSADTKRQIAELARDLHRQVYGRFPKKKRMPTGNGAMLPIYFYNRTTYVPTMKEAMTRLLLAPTQQPAAAAQVAQIPQTEQ